MRKGLSISVVAGVVLALVGISLLINVYLNTVGGEGGEGMFCAMYHSIGFVFPGDLPPAGCGGAGEEEYREVSGTEEDLEHMLVPAITNCFQDYEGYLSEDDEVCQGWNVEIQGGGGPVSDGDIEETLEEYCGSVFGSEDPDCLEDYLEFPDPIEDGDFILIKYRYDEDEEQEKIVVE